MRLVILLAIALALSGCAKDAAPTDEAGLQEAPDDTMAIRGVVVDNAITPLEGVLLAVAGTNFTLTTAADGEFFIPVAQPGGFELDFSHADFMPQKQLVMVAEGDVVDLQVVMESVAVLQPMSEVKKWEGFIQCSVRIPQNAFAPCAVVEELGDDSVERYEEIDTPPTIVQSELIWTSAQPLAESLRIMYTDDHKEGTDNYRVAQGTSPIAVRADAATLQFKHLDTQGLYLRVFTGDFQATGTSLTLQQGFTVFTTVYQNYAPPEDWMFVENDAVHPPP